MADCDEFERVVRRTFGYLFERYGFRIAERRKGEDGQYCILVLRSPLCQAKAYLSVPQNEGNLEFGPLEADVEPSDAAHESRYWYYARAMVGFVTRRHPQPQDLYEEGQRLSTPEDQLAAISGLLEPVCTQVIYLFREGVFGTWQGAYESFQEESHLVERFQEWLAQRREGHSDGVKD